MASTKRAPCEQGYAKVYGERGTCHKDLAVFQAITHKKERGTEFELLEVLEKSVDDYELDIKKKELKNLFIIKISY